MAALFVILPVYFYLLFIALRKEKKNYVGIILGSVCMLAATALALYSSK
jgi:hypothetical protein